MLLHNAAAQMRGQLVHLPDLEAVLVGGGLVGVSRADEGGEGGTGGADPLRFPAAQVAGGASSSRAVVSEPVPRIAGDGEHLAPVRAWHGGDQAGRAGDVADTRRTRVRGRRSFALALPLFLFSLPLPLPLPLPSLPVPSSSPSPLPVLVPGQTHPAVAGQGATAATLPLMSWPHLSLRWKRRLPGFSSRWSTGSHAAPASFSCSLVLSLLSLLLSSPLLSLLLSLGDLQVVRR